MRNTAKTVELFDLTHTLAGAYLHCVDYPFEALSHIGEWIAALSERLDTRAFEQRGERVWVAKSAIVAPTALICGPAIIGKRSVIRHGAYIRGDVLIGEDCVIGNSTEIKNSIVFDGAQLPHYNYVGDSVIGYRAHFGAGAIASNVRADKRPVVVHTPTAELHTDRRKVGAMVGDGAEIGCGAVLAPGAVIGRESTVYPLTFVRGCVPCGVIVKSDKSIIKRI